MTTRVRAAHSLLAIVAIVGAGADDRVAAGAIAPVDRKAYLEDFEFIDETVRAHAAAIRSKGIDWKRHASRLKGDFAACSSDEEHVGNCMRLLAGLRDSHSDVTRVNVPDAKLPGKFDGLYGAALDFAWDDGKFVLRGIKEGHAQASRLVPGSVLVAVGDEPAWLVFARDRARIERWLGISSLHSLYASLSNRLLPFGEANELKLTFLEPGGETSDVTVARWGPGGKAFYPSDVEFPDGVTHADGAVSAFVDAKWSKKVGYLRITGQMDRATADAFHRALDELQGLEALLLDCRWMGGGGDGSAWEMAGRLYPKGVDNGRNGRIEPTGTWQFDGPVVMLQNESEVSSAETFTWALSEPGRAVSVGRPTGGWGIIPKGYSCPSGLLEFRIGVNDRPTPIGGVHTEGIGWPPDVLVPWGPIFCAEADPVRSIGMDVLAALHGGASPDAARDAFGELFEGEVDPFVKKMTKLGREVKGFDPARLAKRVSDDLAGELDLEFDLARQDGTLVADAIHGADRIERLVRRAKAAGMGKKAGALEKLRRGAKAEAAAQEAWIDLELESDGAPGKKGVKAFLTKFGRTETGRAIKELSSRP